MKAFEKVAKKEAGMVVGKGLGGGMGLKQGVKTEALGRLIERLNIGINFAQNLGMVAMLEVLPVDFKKWFEWIGALGLLALGVIFGGIGKDVSIW